MLTIRRALASDVPALTHLLGELFAEAAEFTPDADAQRRGLAAIISDPAAGTILVAEEHGRTVAMANLLYTISTAKGGRMGILDDLAVERELRGRGIGTRLLTAAVQAARDDGCLVLKLLVEHDNAAALSLYRRLGFESSALLPMRLELAPAKEVSD
jgi:ribosomal protein S18 acetylase RimI-like enzyme